jgi:hypothetical protein
MTWFLYTAFPVTRLQPPEHSGLAATLTGYHLAVPKDPLRALTGTKAMDAA